MTAASCIGVAIEESAAIPETYSFKRAADRLGVLSGTTRLRRQHNTAQLKDGLRETGDWANSASNRGPITFDRRRLPRKEMKGFAMAVFTQGACAGTVVRVELVDGSHTGLGIKCPIEITLGSSFSLIPEHPMMPRAVGLAVRCEDAEGGFRIGLRTRLGVVAA